MRAGSKNRIIMGHILFLRDSITLLTSHQIIAHHGSLASIPERSTAVYPWPVRRAAHLGRSRHSARHTRRPHDLALGRNSLLALPRGVPSSEQAVVFVVLHRLLRFATLPLGRHDEAIADLDQTLRLDPGMTFATGDE